MPFQVLMPLSYYVKHEKFNEIMQTYTQVSYPCEMCTTLCKKKLPYDWDIFPIIIIIINANAESCGKCLDNASTPVSMQLICSRDQKENLSQQKGYVENIAVATV